MSDTVQIDLHGMERARARQAVTDALQACRRSGVRLLRINHGKGTGVLREEVWFLLENHPAVEDLRFAKPREGGDGVTEARLRRGRGRPEVP